MSPKDPCQHAVRCSRSYAAPLFSARPGLDRPPLVTIALATKVDAAIARPNPIVTLALISNTNAWLASTRTDVQKAVPKPAAASEPTSRKHVVVGDRENVATARPIYALEPLSIGSVHRQTGTRSRQTHTWPTGSLRPPIAGPVAAEHETLKKFGKLGRRLIGGRRSL
jgi:hypothetical protein